MIYNHVNGSIVYDLNAKQKKLLKSIGVEREYGSDFNGFGYANKHRVYSLNEEQYNLFLSLGQEPKKVKKEKTEEEKMQARARRLDRLTSCGFDVAMEIAKEKIEYKKDRIREMECRQANSPSIRRQRLINKMHRENPLRRIKDVEHANAILVASNRHRNSNYEFLLEEARDNLVLGVDRSEVKEYARSNMQYIM